MEKLQCTRCKRLRFERYLTLKKNYSGKRVLRCRAVSVCASKARRLRQAQKKTAR